VPDWLHAVLCAATQHSDFSQFSYPSHPDRSMK